MYIGYKDRIYFIDSQPLRRVTYRADYGEVERVADEHDIWFTFPTKRTGIKWGYLILMPIAFVVDAVTCPLQWVAVVNQHG
ncbi:MAG: hypothetical protein HC853_09310 [Anaerolineae bacterium]|nr:hypothetical protein [Anaerolineae bacterium]